MVQQDLFRHQSRRWYATEVLVTDSDRRTAVLAHSSVNNDRLLQH